MEKIQESEGEETLKRTKCPKHVSCYQHPVKYIPQWCSDGRREYINIRGDCKERLRWQYKQEYSGSHIVAENKKKPFLEIVDATRLQQQIREIFLSVFQIGHGIYVSCHMVPI